MQQMAALNACASTQPRWPLPRPHRYNPSEDSCALRLMPEMPMGVSLVKAIGMSSDVHGGHASDSTAPKLVALREWELATRFEGKLMQLKLLAAGSRRHQSA